MAKKRIGVLVFLVIVLFFQEALNAGGYSRIDNVQSVEQYTYGFTMNKNHNQKLKNYEYGFLEKFHIPGMPSTKEIDVQTAKIPDTSLCPQGICTSEEYLFVTAYSTEHKDNLGCIYVFDKFSGEYLVTLGAKRNSHLGGITFDGENLWICHSDTDTLESIPYGFVQRIVDKKPRQLVDCSALFVCYQILNRPSCIAFYDGKLWVATHTKEKTSKMYAYEIKEKGLVCVGEYAIPSKVQGIAFDEEGVVYLSCSYGRTRSSYLKIYPSIEALQHRWDAPDILIEMPPCAEELVVTDTQVYIIFESAGEKYYMGTDGLGRSVSPIENILTISKKSIFD